MNKKTVRIAATAFSGFAAGVAGAFPAAAPVQAATRSYEVRILASSNVTAAELNNGSTIQVCGHNQNNKPTCDYTKIGGPYGLGPQSYITPNYWWIGPITIWWNHHHSQSNAGCNVQNMPKDDSGYYADGHASFGNNNCG